MEAMIRLAEMTDVEFLSQHDHHLREERLHRKIEAQEILVMCKQEQVLGWLRYGYFWDNIPFMNMLFFEEAYRKQGYGSRLVRFWEEEMKQKGYERVLTSTQADEEAQFFYRKLGYKDVGCLLLGEEPTELFLMKKLMISTE